VGAGGVGAGAGAEGGAVEEEKVGSGEGEGARAGRYVDTDPSVDSEAGLIRRDCAIASFDR